MESRHQYFNSLNQDKVKYNYLLTDIVGLVSIKTGLTSKANVAYTLRLSKGKTPIHRTTQQFNIIQSLNNSRIGHRVAADQTFVKNSPLTFRLRYKVVFEKPLSGTKIDPKEFYLKLGNEYLWINQAYENDLEIRILPFLGYELNLKNRLEFGPDYRIGDVVKKGLEQTLWMSIAWYCSI